MPQDSHKVLDRLYNELIEIDDVLKKILPESNDPIEINKREMFLKIICDDKHYSNEKYQTIYIELLLKNYFHKNKAKISQKIKKEKKISQKNILQE